MKNFKSFISWIFSKFSKLSKRDYKIYKTYKIYMSSKFPFQKLFVVKCQKFFSIFKLSKKWKFATPFEDLKNLKFLEFLANLLIS